MRPELIVVWFVAGFVLGMLAAFYLAYRLGMKDNPATIVGISQSEGDYMITGVQVGAVGKFTATFNGALQAGAVPKWQTGDTSITLTPSADGLSCEAAVAAGETLPSFGLTVTGVASDGNTVTTTVSIPVLPATPPPPPPATAVTIDQTA